MKLYRCQICGDPYLGSAPPSNCPFCGAPQKYIVLAEDYVDQNDIPDLTPRSRENLEKALDLEVRNSAFYLCAAACSPDAVAQAMFKAREATEERVRQLFSALVEIESDHVHLSETRK